MMKKHFRLHIPVAYYSPVTTFPPAWPRQQVSSSSTEANDWFCFWFGTSFSSMLHSVKPCLLAAWLVRFYSLLVYWLICWVVWFITVVFVVNWLVGQFFLVGVVTSSGFWFVGWEISWFVCWQVSFFLLVVFWLAG